MYKRCRYIKKRKIFITIALLGAMVMFSMKWVLATSPKIWIKKQTIVVYKWVYGDKHKAKLHQHLSFSMMISMKKLMNIKIIIINTDKSV